VPRRDSSREPPKYIGIGIRRFNGITNDRFSNIEGLRNKFLIMILTYLKLTTHSTLQRVGQEYRPQDSVYTSYFKEICKIAKCGRNARGLAVYIRDDINKRVTEISADMK
jgi:hypothetical protein